MPAFSQDWDQGQPATARTYYVGVDTPNRLQAILDWDTGDELSTEYYIKRLYNEIWITNTSMFPVHCQAYWLYCRRDTDQTIESKQDIVIGSTTALYTSPCTGSEFRKYYKIVKSKNFTMKSGIPYHFKIKSRYAGGKPIQYNVEGSNDIQKRGNMTLCLKFSGIPLTAYDTNIGDYINFPSTISLAGFEKTYCSYYRMDDASDTSSISNNLPLAVPSEADYDYGNPTIMNWAKQNTTLGAIQWTEPPTVRTS